MIKRLRRRQILFLPMRSASPGSPALKSSAILKLSWCMRATAFPMGRKGLVLKDGVIAPNGEELEAGPGALGAGYQAG